MNEQKVRNEKIFYIDQYMLLLNYIGIIKNKQNLLIFFIQLRLFKTENLEEQAK